MILEKDFQAVVVELAKWAGWHVYHALPVQNTNGRWRTAMVGHVGFPDLVLAHAQRGVIFAELKTSIGKLSNAQHEWLTILKAAGAETYVWRPTDLAQIKLILTEGTK